MSNWPIFFLWLFLTTALSYAWIKLLDSHLKYPTIGLRLIGVIFVILVFSPLMAVSIYGV